MPAAVEPPPSAPETTERIDARREAFALAVTLQLEGGISPALVAEMIERGERHGWADVVRIGLYLDAIRAHYADGVPFVTSVEPLLQRAERDGDPAMIALALGLRAQDRTSTCGRAPVDAERDLARASALLETVTEPSTEAVSAHLQCGLACEPGELWELQLRHYVAAEARLDLSESPGCRRATLLYNRAEIELNWAAALREREAYDELAERAPMARAALRAAHGDPDLPSAWRDEVTVFSDLFESLCLAPGAGGPDPGPIRTDAAVGEYAGYAELAAALRTADPGAARVRCERALELIDPERSGRIHVFALALAVELEARQAGHDTAGLRLGRELVARRWQQRLAMVASMESLIEVERRQAEHVRLQQHAYLDDLTGVGNRRALARFADGLRARGQSGVTVSLVDLDRFKTINDTHGHIVGDRVLSRVAGLLRGGIREEDLVVRIGGDEFLLILTNLDRDAARRRCESILDSIAGACWEELSPGLRVTASFGVATGSLCDLDGLHEAADVALYRAKLAGRDRVAV